MNRILIIACAGMLSGCGIFHSSKSSKQLDQRDSTLHLKTQTTSSDTGSYTIHERNDYTFLSPEFKGVSKTFIPPADLLRKLSTGFVSLDTGMLNISVGYDTLKKTLNINATKRPEAGHHHQEKTTTVKNGKTENQVTDQKLEVKKKAVIEQKESKPDYRWIGWLAAIGVVAFFIYRSRR